VFLRPGTDPKVVARLSNAPTSRKRNFEGNVVNSKKHGMLFIIYWRVLPINSVKKTTAWVATQSDVSVIWKIASQITGFE
tara:strand:- start:723 stop:962 length:240 start_codon:yes stop_codon:yes gene_type:complete